MLIIAQREFEERKTQLLANLNAYITIDKEVSRSIADQLLSIASGLSYQRILILQLIGLYQTHSELNELRLIQRMDSLGGHITGIGNVSVPTGAFELYRRSLLHSPSIILDVAGIEPSKLILAGCGTKLYALMELCALNFDTEAHAITVAFLTGRKVMNKTNYEHRPDRINPVVSIFSNFQDVQPIECGRRDLLGDMPAISTSPQHLYMHSFSQQSLNTLRIPTA